MAGGTSPLSVRQINTLRVIETIYRHPATSRAEITRRTGLARQTVSTVIEGLVRTGLVEERTAPDGERPRNTGRPPVLLSLVAGAAYAVGLDFGHQHIRVAPLGKPAFARKFREERTVLALAWLRQSRQTANTLMRIHAQSARTRSDLKASGELRLALEFLAFQLVVALLYGAVSLRGPFHVAALVRYSLSISGRLRQAAGDFTGAAGSLAPQSPGAAAGSASRTASR